MNRKTNLLLAKGLLASLSLAAAAAQAQTAPGQPGAMPQGEQGQRMANPGAVPQSGMPQGVRPRDGMPQIVRPQQGGMPQGGMPQAAAPSAPVPPEMREVHNLLQQAERRAQDAEKEASGVAAERAQKARELKARLAQARTPEEREALKAARAEQRKKELAEMTPEVRAAREQERQVRRAQQASLRAAQEAHGKALEASQQVARLQAQAEAARKPNPALGANFTPQNVAPLLQNLDQLTKRLAAVRTPADLPPPQMAQLDLTLNQLKSYMDRVDEALVGVAGAGVQTPANKEAEVLYARVGDVAKVLDNEMQRIEKMFPNVPQLQAMFAKFRE